MSNKIKIKRNGYYFIIEMENYKLKNEKVISEETYNKEMCEECYNEYSIHVLNSQSSITRRYSKIIGNIYDVYKTFCVEYDEEQQIKCICYKRGENMPKILSFDLYETEIIYDYKNLSFIDDL